jgi:predicted membrane protein
VLGLLSVALLAASFVWAHHWGTLTDTLVAAWAVATLASLVVSIGFLRDKTVWATYGSHRLAKIGLAGGLISVVALVLASIASAAGLDPAGACGGG